jgi:hypothetical protein
VLERKLKAEIDHDTLDVAIEEATTELSIRKEYVPSLTLSSIVSHIQNERHTSWRK